MANGNFSDQFVSFIFTSILAGLVTAGFTYKNWQEETRLEIAKEKLAEATKSFDRASQLMSRRIFSSYQVLAAAEEDDDAAFATKMEKLEKSVEEWNVAYPDLVQDFQFSLEIDENGQSAPYRDIRTREFDKKLRCHEAFEPGNGPQNVDWSSPTWRLAGLHHCFVAARLKKSILALRVKPAGSLTKISDKNPPSTAGDAEMRRQKIEELDVVIDDLKTHSDEVRVAGKRAIARLRSAAQSRRFSEFISSW